MVTPTKTPKCLLIYSQFNNIIFTTLEVLIKMQFIALCADRTASIVTVAVCSVQYQELLSVHVLLVVFSHDIYRSSNWI